MEVVLPLSHREIVRLDRDYREVAHTAKLLYVSDASPGIRRVKKGKGFSYVAGGKRVTADDLARIRKLVIPPAWTRVWICSSANGHIQATGYDLRGRKQYRYHTLWNAA